MKKVKKFFNKSLHTPLWLAILMALVITLRVPTFFEPYSYGDEMIYLTLGEAVRRGVPLYEGVHDNKPPLLYITAAVSGSLFWFKAILAVWHIITIYIFWKLSVRLFPKNNLLQKVSTTIFALFSTFPLLEGNIANAENFMIGFTMAGFYLLLDKKTTTKKLILSGALFSIATMFKVPAAFDIPAIIFLWLTAAKLKFKDLKEIAMRTMVILAGLAAPILFTFIYYWMRGAFSEYLIAAYLQNFGYLSSWRPEEVSEPFLVKNAPLIRRSLLVALGHIILFWKRRSLSKEFLFITSWLLLTLFAVTLSERPYPHYLLQSLAPVSLLFGMLVAKKDMEQLLSIIPLTAFFFVPFYFNFWHYSTVDYYSTFLKFATGEISRVEYFNSFGGDVVRNYKIAEYIGDNSEREDAVYIWGDTAKIYALSNRLPPIRYVADYHINDFYDKGEVVRVLDRTHPKLIIILPEGEDFLELEEFVHNNYGLQAKLGGAEIWNRLDAEVNPEIAP